MLAIIAFIVIEIAGMRALGKGYISTIIYLPPKDMPAVLKPVLFAIMTPVEILGKFTKPFALCIRLFANMTAGHVMVLALISIIFTFGSVLIGIAPVAMAVGIMVLELFVALLQAYVFTLLVVVVHRSDPDRGTPLESAEVLDARRVAPSSRERTRSSDRECSLRPGSR